MLRLRGKAASSSATLRRCDICRVARTVTRNVRFIPSARSLKLMSVATASHGASARLASLHAPTLQRARPRDRAARRVGKDGL